MPKDELHDKLMELRGVVLTVEAEELIDELVAALESEPLEAPTVLAMVHPLAQRQINGGPEGKRSLYHALIAFWMNDNPESLDVTVTITERKT